MSRGRKLRTIDGVLVGWVAGLDAVRGLLVDFPGNAGSAVAARTLLALDPAAVDAAVKARQGAVLQFEDGDPRRPVLMGLVQPLPARCQPLSRRVEGKRVVLEGNDEIVLRCGKSTIILRRNGVVLVSGAQVESRSGGRNVIRGRKVALN